LDVILGPITKFSGAIFLVLGIFLCFFGNKFIKIAFGLLCFLASSAFVFALIYNMGFIKGLNEGKLGAYIGVLVGASLVGVLCAFLAIKYLF